MSTSMSWKTVITSSSILSLALVGDALIYAVLPVHAEAFGINLVWVGVLLSVNRFLRVFAYGWIAGFGQRFGLRRMCIAALLAAIISTALYGLATGACRATVCPDPLGTRIRSVCCWSRSAMPSTIGLDVGSRLGWSRTIQHVGPIMALIAGAWLTGFLGPRTVFVWLALVTMQPPYRWRCLYPLTRSEARRRYPLEAWAGRR